MKTIMLTGFIGADAEIKQQSDNKVLLHFNLAHTKKWKDKDSGEQKEHTDWFAIFKRYNQTPEKFLNHLKKGNKVLVQGEPSFKINSHNQSIRCEVSVNAHLLEILTFDNSEKIERTPEQMAEIRRQNPDLSEEELDDLPF